jgi:formylmethanofuran dehydrogenase subunit E
MQTNRLEFSELLDTATRFHGHLCAGQIIGVRMAMLGLRELGITDPLGKDRKKLLVFVEVSRCAADAIMIVTGCRVGKRSFKLADTGKVAASFIHMESFQGVRIIAVNDVQEKIAARYPGIEEKAAQKKAYREMSDRELFQVQEVMVQLQPEDTPGIPAQAVPCAICGETVLDRREVLQNGTTLCRPCATGTTYYTAQSAMREPIQEGPLP